MILCFRPEQRDDMFPVGVQEGYCFPPSWLAESGSVENYQEDIFGKIRAGEDVILFLNDNQDNLEVWNSFRKHNKEHRFHLHVCFICNFRKREKADRGSLRILPYYFEADSVWVMNIYDLTGRERFYTLDNSTMTDMDEDMEEAGKMAAEYMLSVINTTDYSRLHSQEDHIWFYNQETDEYVYKPVDRTEAMNAVFENRNLYEAISVNENPRELCRTLRQLRKKFAKERRISWSEEKCRYQGPCTGTCRHCEDRAIALMKLSERNKRAIRHPPFSQTRAGIDGIMRFRYETDGPGMRSLVIFDECEMRCRYCFNKENINVLPATAQISVEALGDYLKKDSLYYAETGGGITFGGGEPLWNAQFINEFHERFPEWDIAVETSLNADQWTVDMLLPFVSRWIVDIKDINPGIYKAYTGFDNERVISNLRWMADQGAGDRIIARLPHIKYFNTNTDVEYSKKFLEELGITHMDEFTYQIPEDG